MNVQKPEPDSRVIIGSGAAGGMAAWNLTRQGINVLVLDAGERFDRAKFWSHVSHGKRTRAMKRPACARVLPEYGRTAIPDARGQAL